MGVFGGVFLVRVVLDGADRGVHVPHGAPLSFPLAPGSTHDVRVTAEIWGRANFDEVRRPSLRLGAGRGVGRPLAVTGVEDVTDLWSVRSLPDRRTDGPLAQQPLRGLGGWSSTRAGVDAVYVRDLEVSAGGGLVHVLRLVGLTHPVRASVDGGPEQIVMPAAPVLVLERRGADGPDAADAADRAADAAVEVAVRAPHVPGGLVERVELLTAVDLAPRAIRAQTAQELVGEARREVRHRAAHPQARTELPLRVRPGRPAVLRLGAPPVPPVPGHDAPPSGALLDVAGEDVEVTVIAGERRVSRHVLSSAAVSGGDPHRSWIPAGWAGSSDDVLLLVEAMSADGGVLEGVSWSAVPR